MTHHTGPRPTPLTEIEKAELLDAIPGDLPLRQTMRRALMELDFSRADLATLRQHVDICEHLIREHSDAASIFQPGGKYQRGFNRLGAFQGGTAQVAALTEALCPVCWQPYMHDWEFDEGGRPSECRRCGVEWSHATDNERCPKAPTPPWERAALPADAPQEGKS